MVRGNYILHMTKKEFKKPSFSALGRKASADKAKKDINLDDIPFVGGLLKGLEKFINLAEKVEEAGGEIRKAGEIKGLGSRQDVKGIYGFSIRTGIGGKPSLQTFGNIKTAKKKAGEKPAKGWSASGGEVRVTETREPVVDVFDEKDYLLIIAELPGIDEKSINLEFSASAKGGPASGGKGNRGSASGGKKDILLLKAGSEERKYAKEIFLPAQVDPQSQKISYKNGILEIKIKKIKER